MNFDFTVNVGHLIEIAGVLALIIKAYILFDRRLQVLEIELRHIRDDVVELKEKL